VFDEGLLSAQEVARLMLATPHMMGGDMRYTGAFALKVAGIEDRGKAQAAEDALRNVPGVAKVWMYLKQGAVAVEFSSEGDVSSSQLIEALSAAGLTASEFR
jgi:hypothetical protein